ncbi:hypothetical protein NPIL_276151 [Nephila pilipes]|uniref:Uncharacterized protein n=1 Tax=Nephila pilipes TaxID=299642 RepID=A0A8X6UAX5_NEPPI|nr:hypothetical protein NPIL_276151 [Nephila pilipes]
MFLGEKLFTEEPTTRTGKYPRSDPPTQKLFYLEQICLRERVKSWHTYILSGFFFSSEVNPNCVGDAQRKECNRGYLWNKTELILQIKEQKNKHEDTCGNYIYAHYFANQFVPRSPTSRASLISME